MDEEIPADVIRLIAAHIVSVEQLETLLLLFRDRSEWTPTRIAEALRTSAISAQRRLKDLAAAGLVTCGDESCEAYRYASEPARDNTITRLAEQYAQRQYTIIDLIFSKPIKNLLVYADSFRFRKDKDDG